MSLTDIEQEKLNLEYLLKWREQMKDKVPIYRGCPNTNGLCFCTGICKQILGYRDKNPLEK